MSAVLLGMSLDAWVLLAIALGAFAQAATGMGFALVAAPVLIAAMGQVQGVGTILLLSALASIIPLALGAWRDVDIRAGGRILVPTLLATPVIAWALRSVDHTTLAIAGGLAVIIGVVLLASGLRSAWLSTRSGALTTGVASAALNVVGGVGGPPIGLYSANAGWEPARTRGTLQGFFLVQNIVTALVVGLALPSWQMVLALAIGAIVGMALARRLPASAARAGVLGLSALGGIALVAGSA